MKKTNSFHFHIVYFILLGILLLSCQNPTGSTDTDDDDLNGYNDETFFRVDGKDILNRQGQPVVIKGFGLGGWLLPEGYMFKMPGDFGATDVRNEITDLIGAAKAEQWFQEFRDNYVTEADVIAMKEWGVDHIRVPFHFDIFYDIPTESFKESGFERMDNLLKWCKRHRIDVIFDMHAAPGAQSESEISDSDGTARFWTESEIYWPITIKIWEEIARRYKDETIVIGYDIINEPVTPAGYDNTDLARFYGQIVPAIRAIDQNHILFIEGNYYATTFDYLYPPFDDNMVYAFHKYWNETDQGTIQYLLNIRDQYDTPLWLGETGENSNVWFYETKELVENLDIGWNKWTHKKLETITSPLSSPTNPNYEKVVNYWKGNGPRPTAQEAEQGLFQMARDLAIEKTTLRPDVLAAWFSPDFDVANIPYTEINIPGNILAVHYDIGNQGVSYYDTEYKQVSSDEDQNVGNRGWSFRNDGVDIEVCSDPAVEYNIGWIDTGEWLEYTVNVTEAGNYNVRARIASTGSGKMRIKVNNKPIGGDLDIPDTGGFQSWSQINFGNEDFEAGEALVRVEILEGGFNFSMITVD
jgi:endoglucanase